MPFLVLYLVNYNDPSGQFLDIIYCHLRCFCKLNPIRDTAAGFLGTLGSVRAALPHRKCFFELCSIAAHTQTGSGPELHFLPSC